MSAQHRATRQLYEFGEFRLDPARHTLHSLANDEPVTLTPRVYDTLLYMVENSGEVLDKARLLQAIWPDSIVEENNLNQHVSALRRVLGDGERGVRYILTMPRRGYKFVAEVRTAAADVPEPAGARTSIAVLPFVNLTGDAQREYFAEGMAEELIQLLLQIPGVKVPARTSSFVYRQRGVDVRHIAADLQVATVLEGSVSGTDEHVRIHLQLSDGASGHQIWAGSFDRAFRDLFELQREMAMTIVATLKHHIGVDLALPVVAASPCKNLQAYELYLQASSLMLCPHATNLRKVIRLLEQAVALDPQFARAFSQASVAHAISYVEGYRDVTAVHCAEQAARRALALEPSNPMALTTLAATHFFGSDWPECEACFQRSLRLDERETMTHRARTSIYLTVGYVKLALRHARRAYELAPGSWFNIVSLATVLSALDCHNEVTRYIELAASLGVPTENTSLCRLRWYVARRTGDVKMAARNLTLLLPDSMCRNAGEHLLERIHIGIIEPAQRAAAIAALREFDDVVRRASTGVDVLMRPRIVQAVLLRDLDLAFEMMERGLTPLARQWNYFEVLNWHPDLRALRQDPRFQGIVQRFRLIDYWKLYGGPDGCELQGERLVVH